MGTLLPSYKKALIDEIITAIQSNTSQYYAFGANPIAYTGNTPAVTSDIYTSMFYTNWQMLFGKKLTNNDIVPVIKNYTWTTNTVYTRYDSTDQNLYDKKYYVISPPDIFGGAYNVFVCIDNANGQPSSIKPTQTQATSFQTADGYVWRYISSIPASSWDKFNTLDYAPIYSNTTIVAGSSTYSGIEVIPIVSPGSGYDAYHDGIIQSISNTTVLQIQNSAKAINGFYNNNSIYIYNTLSSTGQLLTISDYVANQTGNWITLATSANVDNIIPSVTNYSISPRVVFKTDGEPPKAYTVVNPYGNSIGQIVIIDNGSNISRANVYITSSYGSGANIYAILPPPGGHGFDPVSELNVQGYGVAFNFANSEANTIVTSNVIYNRIGLIKNPYSQANNVKGTRYYANTFSQLTQANVIPSTLFNIGDKVIGANSGARGYVVFSNTTQIYISGDKYFMSGETITVSNGVTSATININKTANIYTKDLYPLYVQNVSNVNRKDTQTESFKIIIKV